MSTAIAQDATAHNGKGNQRDQPLRNLTAAADGGRAGTQAAATPQALKAPSPKLDAARSTAALSNASPCYTCKLRVKVAVFFDGTGNNLEADVGTGEHSNVARLFRSHPESNSSTGVYRAYVPGLGTYFKEIGDPGDEDGMRFGAQGEPRLKWAMDKIDEFVANHPVANITGLDIALFGFSRGAALARAFALRIQERCKGSSGNWRWDKGGLEARLYFIGLFDTVASVGLPASSGVNSARIAKKWVSLDQGLYNRRHASGNGLQPISDQINLGIGFGTEPGADPTPASLTAMAHGPRTYVFRPWHSSACTMFQRMKCATRSRWTAFAKATACQPMPKSSGAQVFTPTWVGDIVREREDGASARQMH